MLIGWTLEPTAAVILAGSVTLYSLGLARMSGPQRRAIAPAWRAGCYYAAALVLVVALFSPLDGLADGSFAWHMGQHLLLMLIAAPLLALANTHLVSLFALAMSPRRLFGRVFSGIPGVRLAAADRRGPFLAALLFALGLWLWHAPRMYDTALENAPIHTLEHLTFLITSAVFWRMVLNAGDRRLDAGSAILLTVIVGLQANLLAALIVLAPSPIYSVYAMNDLADQQVGGILMLVPASLVFVAATVIAIGRLVRSGETQRRGRPTPKRVALEP